MVIIISYNLYLIFHIFAFWYIFRKVAAAFLYFFVNFSFKLIFFLNFQNLYSFFFIASWSLCVCVCVCLLFSFREYSWLYFPNSWFLISPVWLDRSVLVFIMVGSFDIQLFISDFVLNLWKSSLLSWHSSLGFTVSWSGWAV